MLKAVIFSLVFSLSLQSFARPLPDQPNARYLLRKKMKELKTEALKVSFIPILNLISIPRWKKYNHCKQVYFYFKSAYVLSHKSKHTKQQIKKATIRLLNLMEKLKEETAKVKDTRLHTLDAKDKAQKHINARIQRLNLKALTKILEAGDRVIPQVLVHPGSNELKYDSEIFRETLRTVSDDPNFYHKSIFEASVLREKEELRRNPTFLR